MKMYTRNTKSESRLVELDLLLIDRDIEINDKMIFWTNLPTAVRTQI